MKRPKNKKANIPTVKNKLFFDNLLKFLILNIKKIKPNPKKIRL